MIISSRLTNRITACAGIATDWTKKGNPTYRPLGYFGSLKELLNYWTEYSVRKELSNIGEITLSDVVEIIKSSLEEYRKTIENAIPDISEYPDK